MLRVKQCTTTLLVAVFAFLPMQTLQANDENLVVSGSGAMSCAQFAQNYAMDTSVELVFYEWAEGFMSGLNFQRMMLKKNPRDLSAQPVTAQNFRLRGYCEQNPLKTYLEGVITLYTELPYIEKN